MKKLANKIHRCLVDPLTHWLVLLSVGCVVSSPVTIVTAGAGLALSFLAGFWAASLVADRRVGRILAEHHRENMDRIRSTSGRVRGDYALTWRVEGPEGEHLDDMRRQFAALADSMKE